MTTTLKIVLIISACILGIEDFQATEASENKNQYVLMCYWDTLSHYRNEKGKFSIEDLAQHASLCTHLIYGYASVSGSTKEAFHSCPALDLAEGESETDPDAPQPWCPEKGNDGKTGIISKLMALKEENPSLKVMLGLGGPKHSSKIFSDVSFLPSNRRRFANSTASLIKRHGFDGLEVQWLYPRLGGGSTEDRENFVLLLEAIKEDLKTLGEEENKSYEIAVTLGARKQIIDQSYNLIKIAEYADFLNLMLYDFRKYSEEGDPANQQLGHHTPIYPKFTSDEYLNLDDVVKYVIDLTSTNVTQKVTLGIAGYARSYALRNPNENRFNDPSDGPGPKGPYTNEDGFLAYFEVCDRLVGDGDWNVLMDRDYLTPYAYSETEWISYDDEMSVQTKVNYAVRNGLAGLTINSIDLDDCKNLCKGWLKCPITSYIKQRLEFITSVN